MKLSKARKQAILSLGAFVGVGVVFFLLIRPRCRTSTVVTSKDGVLRIDHELCNPTTSRRYRGTAIVYKNGRALARVRVDPHPVRGFEWDDDRSVVLPSGFDTEGFRAAIEEAGFYVRFEANPGR